ncbi:hypothetical protein Tco_0686448 [Tanacetum coccineum]
MLSPLKIQEEPSHTVEDSSMQQDQEFVIGDNDEQPADKKVTKADCQAALTEEPPTSFDEFNDTSFDFSAFVLNRLKMFDLRKPLPLIQDHRGRQIMPKDFINKDLEYLKGGDLSRRYSTSVKYYQHAYLGTSHWGPKRQRFYGYASNLTSSKDVYSKRRIIVVTRLKIIKKYNYSHLEEIEVCQDDQDLYTFKEGDFKRLRLQDIEDMLLLLVQQKLTNITIDERYDLNV